MHLVRRVITMLRQIVVTRFGRTLITSIIRESAINVTLQNIIGHVKVSGRVLKLFPWQARDNVRWYARWVWPTRRNKTIQYSYDSFLSIINNVLHISSFILIRKLNLTIFNSVYLHAINFKTNRKCIRFSVLQVPISRYLRSSGAKWPQMQVN